MWLVHTPTPPHLPPPPSLSPSELSSHQTRCDRFITHQNKHGKRCRPVPSHFLQTRWQLINAARYNHRAHLAPVVVYGRPSCCQKPSHVQNKIPNLDFSLQIPLFFFCGNLVTICFWCSRAHTERLGINLSMCLKCSLQNLPILPGKPISGFVRFCDCPVDAGITRSKSTLVSHTVWHWKMQTQKWIYNRNQVFKELSSPIIFGQIGINCKTKTDWFQEIGISALHAAWHKHAKHIFISDSAHGLQK